MIEYLMNYSYFVLQTLTIVLLLFLPIILIIRGKSGDKNEGNRITIEHINANFEDSQLAFETVLSDKKELTKHRKNLKNSRKKWKVLLNRDFFLSFVVKVFIGLRLKLKSKFK